MAVRHYFKKAPDGIGGTGLFPSTEAGQEWLDGLPMHEIVSGEFKRPRNIKHHQKFFAMLNLIWKNQEHYKSVDDILLAFKYHIGHGHWIAVRRSASDPMQSHYDYGEIFQPHSISFAKMDQSEFEAFYEKAVAFVCEAVIPGLHREDLERELMEFTK